MKYILLFLLVCLGNTILASDTLRIGVIADTHYLSEKLMNKGLAIDQYMSENVKNVKATPEVLDSVLSHYTRLDKLDILLVCGDMSKDGEKQSHIDFVEKLKPIRDKGTKIFVIPGNHDINMPNAYAYMGDNRSKAENTSPEEFVAIYNSCGYGQAINRDSSSLSYVAQLNSKTWLLAVDVAKYKEYTDQSLSSGSLNPNTEKWLTQVLDEAREKNIKVLGIMHWGLVEHLMNQSSFFKEYLVDDWERLAKLFADKGMQAIFTGHFHANDITALTSDKGNTIYDIETGTLSSYPFAYRDIKYYHTGMDIHTYNLKSTKSFPNLYDDELDRVHNIVYSGVEDRLKRAGFELPDFLSDQLSKVIAKTYILHMQGDEDMSEDAKSLMLLLSSVMDSSETTEDIELDFFPADNNLTITF